MEKDFEQQRDQIIGLGENSFKKSYYPELQSKILEVETAYLNITNVFSSINDAIVIHDENGEIYLLNKHAEDLFNLKSGDKDKYRLFDLFSDKLNYVELLEIWKDIKKGHPKIVNMIVKPLNRNIEFQVQTSINRVYWYGKNLLVAVLRDFSDRAKFEEELVNARESAEKSEKALAAIIENIPFAVFAYTLDGRILMVNNLSEVYTKYSRYELLNMSIEELDKEFSLEGGNQKKWESIKDTGFVQFISSIYKKDKEKLLVEVNITSLIYKGKQIMLSVVQDITKRMEAEIKLQKSEERLNYALSAANDGIWDICVDGSASYFNDQYYKMLGYEPYEFPPVYESFVELLHPEDRERVLNSLKQSDEKDGCFESEFRLKMKNGEYKWILGRGRMVETRNNAGYRMVGTHVDISERKNYEEQLMVAKEKAEESNRLKSAFLQNMSHEIRTPLNAINGFTGLLNNPDIPEENKQNFISIIQSSSKQLLRIVSDVLTISALETKQEEVKFEEVNINTIILSRLAEFKEQANNQNLPIYTKLFLTDNEAFVLTDKSKLTQIINNLLSNALKFTHEGSVEFGYELHNKMLEFFVKDTGIGITDNQKEKIFGRFNQADNSIQANYGGTGLGLSISQGFVELLGGKIWVESEFGRGSTFYFTIPYNPITKKATNKDENAEKYKRGTILIAEDEEINYLFLEVILKKLDFIIIHAKNGKEAVELCKNNKDINLVLMDIKMPVMDGATAAKLIKEMYPNLPVIAQTAYGIQQERDKYENLFDEYLVKPIKNEELCKSVLEYFVE